MKNRFLILSIIHPVASTHKKHTTYTISIDGFTNTCVVRNYTNRKIKEKSLWGVRWEGRRGAYLNAKWKEFLCLLSLHWVQRHRGKIFKESFLPAFFYLLKFSSAWNESEAHWGHESHHIGINSTTTLCGLSIYDIVSQHPHKLMSIHSISRA